MAKFSNSNPQKSKSPNDFRMFLIGAKQTFVDRSRDPSNLHVKHRPAEIATTTPAEPAAVYVRQIRKPYNATVHRLKFLLPVRSLRIIDLVQGRKTPHPPDREHARPDKRHHSEFPSPGIEVGHG